MNDFIVRGSLEQVDPELDQLIRHEAERQVRKLILIPSESSAPQAVREGLGSVFQNIYAEGYPDEDWRTLSQSELLDYEARLGEYRRFADPRYYKGVEYTDVLESLARRRCAEVFATPAFPADKLFVNVQALSGAPANNAVYTALINPGDTILGMNLLHGGHLTHGSSVNRSGKLFKALHYAVNPETEKIDYDALLAQALEHRPRIIIAGYSSYSWLPDWQKFRKIADACGAYLLADISHIAGMIAAGKLASPVGHAHIITFTTHKTLCGPRGACIITTDPSLARKIDRGVFPGEQGGPHMNAIAAIATMFRIAGTEQFGKLQEAILRNALALSNRLAERGLRIPFKGTDTHLTNVDCHSVKSPDGTPLSGDIAARILDIAGIVVNRNTIPGDKSALNPSGIRLGSPWMTQRGLDEADMREVADIIADVLFACHPYTLDTQQGPAQRAKVDFKVLCDAQARVAALCRKAGSDSAIEETGYPHFYGLQDQSRLSQGGMAALAISGTYAAAFSQAAFSANLDLLADAPLPARLVTTLGTVNGTLSRGDNQDIVFQCDSSSLALAATWLRALSDGYIRFDDDLARRLPGPVRVNEVAPRELRATAQVSGEEIKPFYIGMPAGPGTEAPLPSFTWTEPQDQPLKRTPLYDTHLALGARMVPFGGWEMPVWYSSVIEEHAAVRQAAGLFDVAHMGVYQAEGEDACAFLDSVCGNDISLLAVGESCYTHFLDTQANVLDDTLVYRRTEDTYLVVVNASNDDKDWAWLQAVRSGSVRVDEKKPAALAFGQGVVLRNLRNPAEGDDQRVDIALQGPKSRDILFALGLSAADKARVSALKRTQLCEAVIGGFDLIVSRTGYTGEKMAYELFVHPAQAVPLWNALLAAGKEVGIKPCGLGARDSLRTEAGLPLYGHEMGGDANLGVAEAGFGAYVKAHKPWFIGRDAFLQREKDRKGVVCRFRFNDKGVRMAHSGDPVLDLKGRVIGQVTSCAIDSEGYLTGQAFLEWKSTAEGTPILIYQGAPKSTGKVPAELQLGDRTTLPAPATVVSRFPRLG